MSRVIRSFLSIVVRLALRYRLATSAGVLGTLVFFSYQTTRIPIDAGFEVLLSERSEIGLALSDLRRNFSDDLELILMVEGEVRSPTYLSRLRRLHEALEAIQIDRETTAGTKEFGAFERITSILNTPILVNEPGHIELDADLTAQLSEARRDRLNGVAKGGDHSIDPLIDASGEASLLVLRFGDVSDRDLGHMYTRVTEVVDRYSRADFKVSIAGYPAFTAELSRLLMSDMARLLGFAILVAFGMLVLIFRHPIGIVGPVLVFTIASVVTYGTMTLCNVPLTLITLYLPAFLICVGMADGVHVQTAYRNFRAAGVARDEAIVAAFEDTAMPLVLTTLTTCIGLLSLNTAQMAAVRQLGTFAALGMATSLVATVIALPLVLGIDTKLGQEKMKGKADPDWIDRFLAPFQNGVGRRAGRRSWPFWISLGVFAASLLAMTQLSVYHDPLDWMPADHGLAASMHRVDQNFAGSSTITLLVEPVDGATVRNPDLLARLDRLSTALMSYRDPEDGRTMIGHVTSVLDPVRETWRALEPTSNQEFPTTMEGTDAVFTMLELFAGERLKDFVTLDSRSTQLKAHVRWADAGTYAFLIDHIQTSIRRTIGDAARVRMTGSALQMHSVADRLLADLMTSFGVALFTIALVMAMLFGSVRLALLSLIPNLIPIAGVLGFMGLAGIPLDVHTVLMVSIALGIVVDDTIHFMHQFRAGLAITGDPNRAVEYAFDHAGRAIVTTTWTLVGGFSVYFAAEMRHLHHVGLLFGLALIIALLCDLTLTPALLARFGAGPSREAMPAPAPPAMG